MNGSLMMKEDSADYCQPADGKINNNITYKKLYYNQITAPPAQKVGGIVINSFIDEWRYRYGRKF